MQLIASLFYLGCLVVMTPLITTPLILMYPLPAFFRYRVACIWLRTAVWLAKYICGMRYQVIGLENIPSTPHLILSKHASAWETFFLGYFFPPQSVIAKRELLWIPFFGWGLAMCSPIIINRSKGGQAFQKIIEQGKKRLEDGFWITIFPEGTRTPPGQRGKYKTGGARLALALGLPVLPVAHNAGYLWPKKGLRKSPGLITVSIGQPISLQGHDMNSLTQVVEDWIETEVARLGDGRAVKAIH